VIWGLWAVLENIMNFCNKLIFTRFGVVLQSECSLPIAKPPKAEILVGSLHGRPHMGKWVQLTPGKMDEKLKSENMQKEQFSEWGWG